MSQSIPAWNHSILLDKPVMSISGLIPADIGHKAGCHASLHPRLARVLTSSEYAPSILKSRQYAFFIPILRTGRTRMWATDSRLRGNMDNQVL